MTNVCEQINDTENRRNFKASVSERTNEKFKVNEKKTEVDKNKKKSKMLEKKFKSQKATSVHCVLVRNS